MGVYKLLRPAFVFFILAMLISVQNAATNISACGGYASPLNTADEVYTLNQSVDTSSLPFGDPCFNVTADNVTLDCQGYTITHDNGYAVMTGGTDIDGADYLTIKNCITTSTTADSTAFLLMNAENATILNNTINTTGALAHGINIA